ncbi:type 1 glutamine amidotransferase [Paenibacillus sp. FJAT-27812]|uniref:type 1 glutamine amidotransferase n=1 Tax=Paenibacillus sp. FJAT-27812 TaxID=1684143 RepID=UPI0006A7BBC4|nr:type 1 glutamine amidotransferase [Paenibacillus sp. FJAT-27812]
MNILAFRHFEFDDDYALRTWASLRGHRLEMRDPSIEINAAWLDETDLLVICGGPMSVYDEDRYPWLISEKQFVKQAIVRCKKVLGICFGAQMIAELLGSPVYRGAYKEIGWHTINRTGEQHPWLDGLPEQLVSFQWHGDTFDLPAETRLLAYSEACKVQAFAYREHVLGLQFHLETTPSCIESMFAHWSSELIDAPYIQKAEQIRGQFGQSEHSIKALHRILDQITAHAEAKCHTTTINGNG